MGENTNSNLSLDALWGIALNTWYCARCQSIHLATRDLSPEVCPVCLAPTPAVETNGGVAGLRREPPELVVPFQIGRQRAQEILTRWVQAGWLRTDELNAGILNRRLQCYFLPLWLVDADVEGVWQAEMGYNYRAASFREHYAGGRWISQQVEETQTRWEKRLGTLRRHYDNVAVPALEKHERWMARLGGYDYRPYKPYSAQMVKDCVIRVPDYAPDAAWMDAEIAIHHTAERECMQAAGADHVRNWDIQATCTHLNWTQMLVPAYVTWYRDGEQTCSIWINGQNGHVDGIRLMSMTKAWIIAAVIAALAILCFLLGVVLTVVGIGLLLILFSLPLGLLAFLPPIGVWIHNSQARRQGSLA